MLRTVFITAQNCPYPKPDEYSPRPPYFIMYYPPLYAQTFQVASFLQLSLPKPRMGKYERRQSLGAQRYRPDTFIIVYILKCAQ
jgi:hypothetical protein